MFIYTIYGNYSLYSKKTLMIALNTIMAGTLNITLNYMFIPEYGYMAAGISTLVSFIVLMTLHYIFVRYFLSGKTINIFKLLNEIYWVIGAYGILLLGEFVFDNIFILQTIKMIYLMIVFMLMYPKVLRRLIVK